jgi:hypothetical protein
MARYRVTISSPDKEAMLDLVRTHRVNVLDHGLRARPGEPFSVDAIVEQSDIGRLGAMGYVVQQREDVDKAGRERQREVGRGNRYVRDPPRGKE